MTIDVPGQLPLPLPAVLHTEVLHTDHRARGSAVISYDERYRYQLDRWWGEGTNRLAICMNNPSTADWHRNDPTITRCIGFARREGKDGISVVNIGAGRATKPLDWARMDDPIGPENHTYVMDLARKGGYLVVAWGGYRRNQAAAKALLTELVDEGIRLWCFGTNQDNSPRHPLFLLSDTDLEPYTPTRGAK